MNFFFCNTVIIIEMKLLQELALSPTTFNLAMSKGHRNINEKKTIKLLSYADDSLLFIRMNEVNYETVRTIYVTLRELGLPTKSKPNTNVVGISEIQHGNLSSSNNT